MRDQSLKKFLFKIFPGLIRDSSVAIFSLIWFGEEILCGKHFFFFYLILLFGQYLYTSNVLRLYSFSFVSLTKQAKSFQL